MEAQPLCAGQQFSFGTARTTPFLNIVLLIVAFSVFSVCLDGCLLVACIVVSMVFVELLRGLLPGVCATVCTIVACFFAWSLKGLSARLFADCLSCFFTGCPCGNLPTPLATVRGVGGCPHFTFFLMISWLFAGLLASLFALLFELLFAG
jgi:hypothetical protein